MTKDVISRAEILAARDICVIKYMLMIPNLLLAHATSEI